MNRLFALLVILIVAVAAFAQSDSEFSRASGGVVEAITKAPSTMSGSFALRQSTGLFGGRGYDGTIGGNVVADRLWFFGAGSLQPQTRFSNISLSTMSTKLTAQRVDANAVALPLPKSFLSLHSTAILSDRMTFNVSVSSSRGNALP